MPKSKARTPALKPNASKSKVRPNGSADSGLKPSPVRDAAAAAHPASVNGQTTDAAPPSNKSAELAEKIKELVRLAQEQGYLTYGDINDALPESLISAEELDDVYIKL